jgi:hypothetical protein
VPIVRELDSDHTGFAYDVVLELRPEVGFPEEIVARVNDVERPEGYRLIVSSNSERSALAAVAGFSARPQPGMGPLPLHRRPRDGCGSA